MKNTLLFPVFIIGLSIQSLTAQEGGRNAEKIEAMKIAFITERVGLTPDEAKAFWPVFNQFESEQKTLRKKHRQEKAAILEDFSNASDAEIEKMVDGEIIFRQQELDILKKYQPQFKKILPIKKVALLYKAWDDFQKELLKKIQEKGSRRQ